jgi:Ankyrin repeats (3 copies)
MRRTQRARPGLRPPLQEDIVRTLLAAPGIDATIAADDGRTPLFAAAAGGHAEAVRLLLAAPGADVNAAMEDGSTPFLAAAKDGHDEVGRTYWNEDPMYGRQIEYQTSYSARQVRRPRRGGAHLLE